jgi:archaellum component FlaF (FlaF/FlaG flagellin family)
MRPISVTVTGVNVSAPIPMDYTATQFSVGIGCTISSTATYTVEHTFDDIWSPTFNPATAAWLPNSGLTAKTANSDGNYAFPVRAIRLNVAASAGTVTMNVIQSTSPSIG